MTMSKPWPKFRGHEIALDVLCAHLTRDLFAIAKFLLKICIRRAKNRTECNGITKRWLCQILPRPNYFRQGTLCKRCFLSVNFVREQDYCTRNQPISLKLGVTIEPTNRKNCRLTFGGALAFRIRIPDHFSTSLTAAECGLGDFRILVAFSHTVKGRFSLSPTLGKMNDADIAI